MISVNPSSSTTRRPRALRSGAMAIAAVAVLAFAATSAPAAEDAAALFTKNCASCHGKDGKGKTKTGEKLQVKDLTSAEVKGELTKAKAIESMTNGVKGKEGDKLVMKAYADKLSKAEIEALADYVLAIK